MAGNAWEWVSDSYTGYPGNTYEQQEDFGDYFKVVRGGSWDNAAQHVRSTFRQNNPPNLRSDGTGFRCAVSVSDVEAVAAGTEADGEESLVEPTAEPTTEPTGEPTEEPTSEPPAEPTLEPTEEATEAAPQGN